MPQLPTELIDFHVHLFPDQLFDAIWDYFDNDYKWIVLHRLYHEQCINYLLQRQVTRIVYSNYAHKEGVAHSLNEWNLNLLNRCENLYCFGAFHPDDGNGLQMAEKMLDHPRFIGFKLQLLVQNIFPTDERLFPLYELVIEKKKRLLFHVGTGPKSNPYVGYQHFLPLIRRYPQLPANIAHLGGFEFEPFFELLGDHKNLMMDTAFCFYKESPLFFNLSPHYLEDNQDRLLYGSDFPNLVWPRDEELQRLLALNLSEEFYQKIFFANANQLLTALCER